MRLRLVNRIRQQLWFPQLLRLTGDLSTEWIHDLRKLAPTPAKNRRGRPCSFKHHRVRSAGEARRQLREPPVAAGTPLSSKASQSGCWRADNWPIASG